MKAVSFFLFCFFLFSCSAPTGTDSIIPATDSPRISTTIKDSFWEDTNPDPENKIGEQLMKTEMLGKLKIGMEEKMIVDAMGDPDKRSGAGLWEADGLYHEDWTYDAAGIELNVSGADSLKMKLFRLRFSFPCTLKTSRNIGIGSTMDEVRAAYRNEITEDHEDEQYLVAGSMYGGIIFNFENGKLSSAFIGAAAE